MSGGCLKGVWKVPGGCLEGIYGMFEWQSGKSGLVMSGKFKSVQVKSGHAKSGQVKSGQSSQDSQVRTVKS